MQGPGNGSFGDTPDLQALVPGAFAGLVISDLSGRMIAM